MLAIVALDILPCNLKASVDRDILFEMAKNCQRNNEIEIVFLIPFCQLLLTIVARILNDALDSIYWKPLIGDAH